MDSMARRFIGAAVLLLASSVARADETPAAPQDPGSQPNGFEMLLVAEGVAGLYSKAATLDPKTTGGVLVLITPLVFAESKIRTGADYAPAAVMLGTGLYDMNAYGKDYDRKKVFRDNMVAWNLMLGSAFLADWLGKDSAAGKAAEHLSFTSTHSGGVEMSYRWTF